MDSVKLPQSVTQGLPPCFCALVWQTYQQVHQQTKQLRCAGSAGAASAQPGEPSRAESVRTGAAPHGSRSSSSDDAARSSAGAPEASNPGSNPNPRHEDLPPLSPAEAGLVPGPPPSWVPKLAVPRQLVDLRCPRGAKTVLHARAQLELFAWFGECARWDGMVQRATLYEARCRCAAFNDKP